MKKPTVLLDPHFRPIEEIFDPSDLDRLKSIANVRWGRNDKMVEDEIEKVRNEIEVIVAGHGKHGEVSSYPKLRATMEVGGKHPSTRAQR